MKLTLHRAAFSIGEFVVWSVIALVVTAGIWLLLRGTWLHDKAFVLPFMIAGGVIATLTLAGLRSIFSGSNSE